MAVVHVASGLDSRLADYRLVSDPELARTRSLFVAEGRFVVARLMDTPGAVVRSVLVSPAAHVALADRLRGLPARVPVFVLPQREFEAVAGIRIHRGCLALGVRPAMPDPIGLSRSARLLVGLEALGNPDNVGGVFRNAAAFGADAVLLSRKCSDPLYRKAIRTSMGATLTVPFGWCRSWPGDLRILRSQGFTVVALTPHRSAAALDEFAAVRPPERLALVFGNEGAGLSDATLALADARIRIPTTGRVDSLNVAVASGIVLSRLRGA